MASESFGFLNCSESISFAGGCLELKESFSDDLDRLNTYAHKDGYIYPPLAEESVKSLEDEEDQWRPVPQTKRPAQMFYLPPSHTLYIENPLDSGNIRHEDAGFLIHLLAYLFETRLQFDGWRFEGRILFDYKRNYLAVDRSARIDFLSLAYEFWKALNKKQRKAITNILFIYGKAKCCEWEWESFMYQYMVFDAIYNFNNERSRFESTEKCNTCGKGGGVTHKERFGKLIEKFGIESSPERVEQIYKTRNELSHEALWCGGSPGLEKKDGESHLLVKCLDRLNSQLIAANLGYCNTYSKSGSWHKLDSSGEWFDAVVTP
ncbi:hypothetical protein [Methylomonas rosea]|uniref:Apea-like HEPN domain-containing protein n=1 Tax=Methylomonas rosea TaxID=2952227 RepID=A0ABT1TXJ2_9GAMM|nr:hypothetical protein [Methylomonas sp. WSC-7]MCQ8118788.1 hypothetical protein [Methylomonas sp. WSC-7]